MSANNRQTKEETDRSLGIGKAPAPTSGNDEVEAMCKELENGRGYRYEAAALIRKQAAQIAELTEQAKGAGFNAEQFAEIVQLRVQIAELQKRWDEKLANDLELGQAVARQLVELQKDAERYRWLRDKGDVSVRDVFGHCEQLNAGLDAAIDAAIAKEKV